MQKQILTPTATPQLLSELSDILQNGQEPQQVLALQSIIKRKFVDSLPEVKALLKTSQSPGVCACAFDTLTALLPRDPDVARFAGEALKSSPFLNVVAAAGRYAAGLQDRGVLLNELSNPVAGSPERVLDILRAWSKEDPARTYLAMKQYREDHPEGFGSNNIELLYQGLEVIARQLDVFIGLNLPPSGLVPLSDFQSAQFTIAPGAIGAFVHWINEHVIGLGAQKVPREILGWLSAVELQPIFDELNLKADLTRLASQDSPEIADAVVLMRDWANSLGVTHLNQVFGPFLLRPGSEESALAFPAIRAMAARLSSGPDASGYFLHEAAHGAAPVKMVYTFDPIAGDAGFKRIQSGWMLDGNREGIPYRKFHVFEEIAASLAEFHAYKSLGGLEGLKSTSCWVPQEAFNAGVDRELVTLARKIYNSDEIFRHQLRLYTHSKLLQAEEFTMGAVTYIFDTLRFPFSGSSPKFYRSDKFPILSVVFNIDRARFSNMYASGVAALDILATELYQEATDSRNAAEIFRRDIGRGQLTGKLGPVVGRLRKAFGEEGFRFIAAIKPYSSEGGSRDDLLLHLFALASYFPANERREIRAQVCSIHKKMVELTGGVY